MSDVPSCSDWLTMKEAARTLRVGARKVWECRTVGMKSITGEVVVLRAWKTPGGYVTTEVELRDFVRKLNM